MYVCILLVRGRGEDIDHRTRDLGVLKVLEVAELEGKSWSFVLPFGSGDAR